MDDLISRQNAIRWVKTECNPYGKPTLDYDSGIKVINHLEKMTPVDAVEIVRCENCKHKYRKEYVYGIELLCQKTYDFNGFSAEVEPNHFCAYGERKTDG